MNSPAWAKIPARCASGPSNPGDAVLLGASGGDDEVCGGEASAWVVAPWSIAARKGAKGRLEGSGCCGGASSIAEAWGHRFRICRYEVIEGGSGYLWAT
jgi:hypothetical protein